MAHAFSHPEGNVSGHESKEGSVMRTRRLLRKDRSLYPARLPSYLLPPVARVVAFDPSLRRAADSARDV